MNIRYDPDNFLKDLVNLDKDGDKVLMIYENAIDHRQENLRTNIVIASFVTMYGRIKLYGLMDMVDNTPDVELLYYDTVNILIFFNSLYCHCAFFYTKHVSQYVVLL
jgi:hypothetical protein